MKKKTCDDSNPAHYGYDEVSDSPGLVADDRAMFPTYSCIQLLLCTPWQIKHL